MPVAEEASADIGHAEVAVKENKKEKPVLSTTLVDAHPQYAGSQADNTILDSGHTPTVAVPSNAPTEHTSLACVLLWVATSLLTVAGQCLFETCDCRFFIGSSGPCSACSHPNLYHAVKPNREDVLTRQIEADRQKQLFLKRKQREQREQEEKQRADAANQPTGPPSNTYPCSVGGCDCARFTAPALAAAVVAVSEEGSGGATGRALTSGQASVAASPKTGAVQSPDGVSGGALLSPSAGTGGVTAAAVDGKAQLLPRVCRKCKHADMYHVKPAEEDDKKKGAKGKAPPKKK